MTSLATDRLSSPKSDRRVRVNLLPAAYELRYQRTRRLQRWVVAGMAVIAVQIAAAFVLRQMGVEARELQRGLTIAEQQQSVLSKHIETLGFQHIELEKQMSLADQLNRKHRWSELLAAITRCLPETVVLTRLESDPAKSGTTSVIVPARATATDKNAAPEPTDLAVGVIISGVATDHDSVATFLRNLNARGHVGRCLIDSTMRQPYLTGEGVLFTIKTKW